MIDVILDKGLVIDAYVRVALIGIEILTIDARIVIASVDTYLRFAEAVNRMDIAHDDTSQGLPELMEDLTSGGAKSKTQGALEGVKQSLFGDDDDDDDDSGNGDGNKSSSRSRASSRSRSTARSGSSRSGSSRSGSSRSGSSRSGSSKSGSSKSGSSKSGSSRSGSGSRSRSRKSSS